MSTISRNSSSRRWLLSILVTAACYSQFAFAQSSSSCNVCGDGLVVGSPDNTLDDPFGDSQVSCRDIDAKGQAGDYSSLECAAIQFSVYAYCDCESASNSNNDDGNNGDDDAASKTDEPTKSPVEASTDAPTSQTTTASTDAPTAGAPTDSPTVNDATTTDAPIIAATETPTSLPTTEQPTPSPTAMATTLTPTLVQTTIAPDASSPASGTTNTPTMELTIPLDELPSVSGMVVVDLMNVAGAMPVTTIAAYEQQVTQFFSDYLAEESPPILNVSAILLRQVFDLQNSENNGRRRSSLRRNLQYNNLAPLQTILQVTGRRDTLNGQNATMDSLLVRTAQENAEIFVQDYLRNATPAINQIYFKPITSVEASQVPEDNTSPTTAPIVNESTSDSGLATGAIVGIIVGGVCILAIFFGVIWYNQVGKHQIMSEITSQSENQRRLSEKSTTVNNADENGDAPMRANGSAAVEKPLTSSKVAPAAASTTTAASSSKLKNEHIPAPPTEEDQDESSEDMSEENIESDVDAATDDGVEPILAPVSTSKVTRQITAPAGKLGIVIDTTLEGPVIHKVNLLSPLEGLLKAGDIIVAINDVDTRAMGSSAITALMIKTANQKRTLTILTNE
ncbi:hypothetical protein MPSEU_000975700 [Mayamaea pseudoterrestris]|nr:hypothetical protein MPSEU_000975700 [Mayamaea pseudoterrestris]